MVIWMCLALNYQCELSPQELYNIIAAHVLKRERNKPRTADYHEAAAKLAQQSIHYYIGRDETLMRVEPVLNLVEDAICRLGVTIAVLDHLHFLTPNEEDKIKGQAQPMKRIKQMAQQCGVIFMAKWVQDVSEPARALGHSVVRRFWIEISTASISSVRGTQKWALSPERVDMEGTLIVDQSLVLPILYQDRKASEPVGADHSLRTSTALHPNFCRDLLREPLSPDAQESLGAWQPAQQAHPTVNIPVRRCVECSGEIPILRRGDSPTCSSRCARTLR